MAGAVRARKPHSKVVAWLDYPKGDLDIAWYHPDEARFVREGQNSVARCVPKVTWFVAPTIGVVQMKIERKNANPILVPLKQSALVEITNQPQTSANDDKSGSAHFANYGGLLRRRYFILPKHIARVERGTKCESSPTIEDEPTTRDLAKLIGSRVPEIAAELTGPCRADTVIFHDLDHPACTNTDWP